MLAGEGGRGGGDCGDAWKGKGKGRLSYRDAWKEEGKEEAIEMHGKDNTHTHTHTSIIAFFLATWSQIYVWHTQTKKNHPYSREILGTKFDGTNLRVLQKEIMLQPG